MLFRLLPYFCLVVALAACGRKAARIDTKPRETAWPTLTPAAAKLDAVGLRAFSDALSGNGVVVRHDALVHSWGKPHIKVDVASASKPVFVHLLFKAIEAGKIASLDEPVVKWEPRLASLNAALGHKDAQITWRHFSNQTSCYGVVEAPGTAFDYNDYQVQLFRDLLFDKVYAADGELATEKALQPALFDLLGAQDAPCLRVRESTHVRGRLVVSPRDFARVGSVYLHGGRWQGKQVIGEQWVKLALNSPLPLSLPRTTGKDAEMLADAQSYGGGKNQEANLGSYSFMWWLNRPDAQGKLLWPDVPADAFAAVGHGGLKVLMVIPSLDLIVAWNGVNLLHHPMWSGGREQMNVALKRLMDAVR